MRSWHVAVLSGGSATRSDVWRQRRFGNAELWNGAIDDAGRSLGLPAEEVPDAPADDGVVLFETIRRFKGLERPVVILCELPEEASGSTSSCTRASPGRRPTSSSSRRRPSPRGSAGSIPRDDRQPDTAMPQDGWRMSLPPPPIEPPPGPGAVVPLAPGAVIPAPPGSVVPQPSAAPVPYRPPTTFAVTEAKDGPAMWMRALWFVFVGWWLTGIVSFVAWLALVTIIGLPLGIWLINRFTTVLTLRPRTSLVYAWTDAYGRTTTSVVAIDQPPWWIRGLWFVFVGWWLSGLVMLLGYMLVIMIVTIPLALMVFNRVPFAASLYRY